MESEPVLAEAAREKMGIPTDPVMVNGEGTFPPGDPEAESTPQKSPPRDGLATEEEEEFGEMQSGLEVEEISKEQVSVFVGEVIKNALSVYQMEVVAQRRRTQEDGESQHDTESDSQSIVLENPEGVAANISTASVDDGKGQFTHVLQKDGYQVFKAMVKLSEKGILDSSDPRSTDYRSKILSLEMILSILQNSGPVFRTCEQFRGLIRQQLCLSLSKNGASAVPAVFELSLAIFTLLLSAFKTHLKMQIEVFLKEIFLHILETSMSSYQHKWIVLQALSRICSDPQSVVDIYLNYDCDLSLHNIFERLVNDLSRIAQGRQAIELGATAQQDKEIRLKGLECLVNVLRCMVEWSKELYTDPNSTGLAGLDTDSISGESDMSDGPMRHRRVASMSMGDGSSGRDHRTSWPQGGNSAASLVSAEQFESLKLKKELMEQGMQLFMNHPKKGLKLLQEKGLVGKTAKDIAEFFHTDDRLDKTAVGEILGESEEKFKEVMYAYVDYLDFGGMDFVPALRLLLSKFRLPGESQKIDRIMEKFASRYCETNPSTQVFATADTAYVLAYSVIMLTTDLHSDRVKRKMTKDDYIKMNRGINDSKDLPRDVLEGIYDDIAANEIRMKDSSRAGKGTVQGAALYNEKQRRLAYLEESVAMTETVKAIMDERKGKDSAFTSATLIEHAGPMLKTAWTSFLSAFSIALKDNDDLEAVQLCLDGFRCAIRVANVFGLQLIRDAFVQSLAKFTKLTTTTGFIEMQPKHIEVIKTILSVAYTDGNYLQSTWLQVMRCISQLELAQLISTGVNLQSLGQRQQTTINAVLNTTDPKKMASIKVQVGETSSQSVVVAVDRIFTGSMRLDGSAIVEFVTALCTVCTEELSVQSGSRMYSLQKIVEISYYNMDRIRLEWSRIWAILGNLFNTAGCNKSDEVSIFVVDSLRQLSMKFLERGEFPNFNFQKDFLRPFEYIMSSNSSMGVKDLVVRCMSQMVCSMFTNIKSGWKNIFSVFHFAASSTDQGIVELASQSTNDIFEHHFQLIMDSFQDGIMCLAEFACNDNFPDISMEAIRLIRQCARHISDTPELFHDLGADESFAHQDGDRIWHKAWFPVFIELSRIITRCKLDVRTRALTVMFEVMKSYGEMFLQHWWVDLFTTVFRIFDNTKFTAVQFDESEWKTTTCNHALYAIMDVFVQFYEVLTPVLLDNMLAQLVWCVDQNNEQLARSCANCLENFVLLAGVQFLSDVWEKVCECLRILHEKSVPLELLSWRPLDLNELSGSTQSLDRDSLSSFGTSASSTILTNTPSLKEQPLQLESGPAPITPSPVPEADTPPPVTNGITSQETTATQEVQEDVPVITTEGVTSASHETESVSERDTSPELKENQDDKLPLLRDEDGVLPTAEGTDHPLTVKHVKRVSSPSSMHTPTAPVASAVKQEPGGPQAATKPQAKKDKEEQEKKPKFSFRRTKKSSTSHSDKKHKGGVGGTERPVDPDSLSTKSGMESADLGKTSKQAQAYRSTVQVLFKNMIVKSVIQLELIQAIDNMIFYPTSSKYDDDRNFMAVKGSLSEMELTGVDPLINEKGMYRCIDTPQMWVLLECLSKSHQFARQFHSNHEQRVTLMKAGFRGKSKPNLLRQETSSLACMLRILFRMLNDSKRERFREQVEEKLLSLLDESLQYFRSIDADNHRESWTSLLLLVFVRVMQLDSATFKVFLGHIFDNLCNLLLIDLKVEVRVALRWVMVRCGHEFGVQPHPLGGSPHPPPPS
jgi:Sec7-like guanine-nucleotide exchange factor